MSGGTPVIRMLGRATNKRATVCLLVLSLAICTQLAKSQFFTKSSKSIPRMGRRSPVDSSPEAKADTYRRMLIDRLVDEYGGNLFTSLLESKSQPTIGGDSRELISASPNGEVYLRNDQPFDWNLQPTASDQVQFVPLARNERGGTLFSQPARQAHGRLSTKSLAMRAFDADRLLQHLASGGSPAMPYDRLIEAKGQRGDSNNSD